MICNQGKKKGEREGGREEIYDQKNLTRHGVHGGSQGWACQGHVAHHFSPCSLHVSLN